MSCRGESQQSVDAYIEAAPEYARPICRALRKLILEVAPELRESIKWSSPCYEGRRLVCAIGAFQKHVRLFFFKGALVPDPDGLFMHGHENASGRSVRFSHTSDVEAGKLRRLVRAAMAVDSADPSKAAPRARRAELTVPTELAAILKRTPKAKACFDALPTSCRREYIEWISTAQRDDTRQRRLQEALAMLKAGRRRNDQYRA